MSADELIGLRHYAAAKLQLEAGQQRSAVQSLHAALRTGSPLVPARDVGDLLRRLEKEFPEEYQLGTYQPLPAEVSITYSRSNDSYGSTRPEAVTNLVLPIPGVSPELKSKEVSAPGKNPKPASPGKP